MSHKQPGLDGRHRDANGQISRKHGNTKVESLRETYGDRIPSDVRSDMHLKTLLKREGVDSLSELVKRPK